MNICYFLTRNLYPYLLPSIMSVLEHNKVRKIYIFCEDDRFPYVLPEQCQVINVTDQPWILRSSPNWDSFVTWICAVRSCYTKLLPRVNKIIQLDVDTIVCDSLQPIWDMDMGNKYICACDEKIGHYKIPGHEKYYNIGVAVLNLKQIRADKFDDVLINALNTWHFQYVEQDAWNVLAYDKFIEMPTRYNECFATGASDDPAVVHYAGYRTWWYQNGPRHEYYDRYKQYEGGEWQTT